MKIQHLRWLFVGLLLLMWGDSWYRSLSGAEPYTVGASASWVNGRYHMAGGTNPLELCFAALIGGLYVLLLFAPPVAGDRAFPGVFRRFIAFWIDFLLAMFMIAPVLGIVPTITEWQRTQQFQWTFERDTVASGDAWIAGVSVFFAFVLLTFYFALPLIRRKPTPGACVLGYQIVSDSGEALTLRAAVLRSLLGFIAVCSAYLAPFLFRDRKAGKFWLDKVFHTHAVRA
jgi:uncharacterized RDD family membrane protein YckC